MKLPAAVESPHVVRVLDSYPEGNHVVLVLEYCPGDLAALLRSWEGPLGEGAVKGITWQLLQGLRALHDSKIMHRDLKPSNVLVGPGGVLKLGDFGLARRESPGARPQYTHTVATRWYRAPELLYGAREYGPAVDMWALGCILGELLGHGPLLPGEHDIHQLQLVLGMFGTPDLRVWPDAASLPDYGKISFPRMKGVPLGEVLPEASAGAVDLLGRMLQLNPEHRPTCEEAMAHAWFFTAPYPCPPEDIPMPRTSQGGDEDLLQDLLAPLTLPAL
mmetsp:Transcript_41359/g.132103  ORF Transcript_41359/g.132103 Transcript_41359/m.132103 type:complete len:275 (-) Transcript_41359:110-934(-)